MIILKMIILKMRLDFKWIYFNINNYYYEINITNMQK